METFTKALTLCLKMETLICKGFETGNGRGGAGPFNSPLGELGGVSAPGAHGVPPAARCACAK